MAPQQAKQQFRSQRDVARNQPYELTNDFDFMLTALIVEAAESSLEYLSNARKGLAQELPSLSTLERIQALWGKFFPGRELGFREYMPVVINGVAVGDEPVTYSAWQMSDGEKAALYLAGRALSADERAVMLIDEPETHFHSLLAVQFWDAIEAARPDVRFIFVTHDMTFAASRKAAQYLLANPHQGLTPIELAADASDLAAVLLGTASLSFYATRVIFCEGDAESLDARLYAAWFGSQADVVQPVGSCEMVFRSVSALSSSSLVANLNVLGVIDRDFRADEQLGQGLPVGVTPLPVHEVETLFSLPGVVEAVATHLGMPFNRQHYEERLVASYKDVDRQKVVLERWKLRVNSALLSVVSGVSAKDEPLDELRTALPRLFDHKSWDFSPLEILEEEKALIEGLFADGGNLEGIIRYMPGKQLRPLPASVLSIGLSTFDNLVIRAVAGADLDLLPLTAKLREALEPYLPR